MTLSSLIYFNIVNLNVLKLSLHKVLFHYKRFQQITLRYQQPAKIVIIILELKFPMSLNQISEEHYIKHKVYEC